MVTQQLESTSIGPLSTLIEKISIDNEWVDQSFAIYCVSYKGIDDNSERSKRLVTLASEIYKSGSVYCLVKGTKKEACYWVLLPRDAKLELKDTSLAIKPSSAAELPTWKLARLLIKAIPKVLSGTTPDIKRFESEGLYYLVKSKKLPKGHSGYELTAMEIDLAPCGALGYQQMLSMSTKTFSPLSWFTLENGDIQKKAKFATRYQLDDVGMLVSKSLKGDYIKKPLYSNAKNRIQAIDITKESYSGFQLSKVGILEQFMKDLKQAYGDSVSLNLQRIPGEKHRFVSDTIVKNHYVEIFNALKEHRLVICDLTENQDTDAALTLLHGIDHLGINAEVAEAPIRGALNILIVGNKDTYKSAEEDPYQVYRKKYQDTVFQSCYPERLWDRRGQPNRHVVEVLLKELLIKLEVHTRKHVIEYPTGPEGGVYYMPKRPQDESSDIRDGAWPIYASKFVGDEWQYTQATQEELEDLELDLGDDKWQVFQGYQRSPVIYWPESGDYAIFIDTDIQMLPEFEAIAERLRELKEGRSQDVPIALLTQFIEENPDSKVVNKLRAILSEWDDTAPLPFDYFSTISYKSNDEKQFYDWLRDQGFFLKTSMRGQKEGYFNASLGFFYNREQGMYFAGGKGSPQSKIENFSHLYVIKHSFDVLPEEVENLFDVYHLRHRLPTVTPYPFKHLREYAEMQRFKS
ncbi:hypothetical protein [Aliivibrio finisterrensis]|uniref:Uncharacterized protein n=1 Tax=Aliivibrio finisterrensis TaxID=511998 RepID=A0A6N6RXD9_9GAMM|nr:hypothetical protein [Aliivibrio finisterrensis]KAB2826285.1 hypothetical protein F8B77_00010 [Aliivibrio finisterrensis]